MQHVLGSTRVRHSHVDRRYQCMLLHKGNYLLYISKKGERLQSSNLSFYEDFLYYEKIPENGKNQLVMFNVDTTDLGSQKVRYLCKTNGLPARRSREGMKELPKSISVSALRSFNSLLMEETWQIQHLY